MTAEELWHDIYDSVWKKFTPVYEKVHELTRTTKTTSEEYFNWGYNIGKLSALDFVLDYLRNIKSSVIQEKHL